MHLPTLSTNMTLKITLQMSFNATGLHQDWACPISSKFSILFRQDQKFDITHLTKYFLTKRLEGDLAIYYELEPRERIDSRGILEVCPFSKRITKFWEKPAQGETTSRNASVVFYFFRAETRSYIERFGFFRRRCSSWIT